MKRLNSRTRCAGPSMVAQSSTTQPQTDLDTSTQPDQPPGTSALAVRERILGDELRELERQQAQLLNVLLKGAPLLSQALLEHEAGSAAPALHPAAAVASTRNSTAHVTTLPPPVPRSIDVRWPATEEDQARENRRALRARVIRQEMTRQAAADREAGRAAAAAAVGWAPRAAPR